jgi:hypothetical protein
MKRLDRGSAVEIHRRSSFATPKSLPANVGQFAFKMRLKGHASYRTLARMVNEPLWPDTFSASSSQIAYSSLAASCQEDQPGMREPNACLRD